MVKRGDNCQGQSRLPHVWRRTSTVWESFLSPNKKSTISEQYLDIHLISSISQQLYTCGTGFMCLTVHMSEHVGQCHVLPDWQWLWYTSRGRGWTIQVLLKTGTSFVHLYISKYGISLIYRNSFTCSYFDNGTNYCVKRDFVSNAHEI